MWLTNKRKGAEDARAREFDAEFDSFLDFTSEPSVDGGSNIIGVKLLEAIVVEKVHVTKLQFEFWYGHDREETRDRPHHRLEDSTDTKFLRDDEAGLLTVAGRPQGVNEIDGVLQIHLACDDYKACGIVEFRRLHRMNSEKDEDRALAADNDLMRKLERHEVVLEVPAWAQFIVKDCLKLQETTATGISFSNDAIKGRVLVDIAGSRSTVKRGMEEVIGRITNHRLYKEGDICLRRIKGEHVDTASFKKTQDAKLVNLSRCTAPFSWERLTPERWCYVGERSSGRRPKGPR
ncbi:hypothetical protein AAVH_32908 [Aphelenchoides avenae]|nr:hypothetical protein AAVH_32908 [Aphelenchus avenae]